MVSHVFSKRRLFNSLASSMDAVISGMMPTHDPSHLGQFCDPCSPYRHLQKTSLNSQINGVSERNLNIPVGSFLHLISRPRPRGFLPPVVLSVRLSRQARLTGRIGSRPPQPAAGPDDLSAGGAALGRFPTGALPA